MKKFLIISLLALFACSCVKLSKINTPPEYDLWKVEKRVDGKKLCGAVFKEHIMFKLFGFGLLKSEPINNDYSIGVVPCRYDTISFELVYDKEYMFVCKKDGQTYYYSSSGTGWADKKPVNKIEYLAYTRKNSCFDYKYDFMFYTDDGIYTKGAGPCEDICIDIWGYAIKQNGKWGFVRDLKLGGIKEGKRYKQIVPCEYEEFVDMIDLKQNKTYIVFARKGSTWHCYDFSGNKITPTKGRYNKAMQDHRQKKDPNLVVWRSAYL